MIILISLTIIFISLLTLYPSFYIGLYGDDWLAIFRYVEHVAPPSKDGWNLFTYYLTPYGSQDIIMGLLYRNFGTNGFYYEVTAYIFRMIAAFSLYPIVFYLTKNKLAAFFAILFFAVTTTGFDSTGWLLTMPTYLSIAFFNIFLYFYLLFHDGKKIKLLILSGIFFYLSYVTASARMIGVPLFILSLETFWLLRTRTLRNIKNSTLRVSFIFIILVIIGISGHSLGNRSDWFDRLTSGLTTVQKLVSEGRSDFLFYPIVTFGGMFIPNFVLPDIQINNKREILSLVFIPAITIILFFLLTFKSNISKVKEGDVYKSLIAAAVWIFMVFIIRKLNLITFSSSNLILLLVTGGLSIIIWILLSLKYRNQNNILTSLFISFFLSLLFFLLAWLWNPSSYIDTTHRYLTTSAVGISIFLATIISLGRKFKNQLILASVVSVLLILHMVSTRTYINKLLDSHSQEITETIWSSIPHIPQVGKEPLVFYFEGDDSNRGILGSAVMFGFPFHIAILYSLTERDKIPVPMNDWKEVISAVEDGRSFVPYGYPPDPIPINQIYAFKLEGKDNLINITDEIRQKLAEETQL